MRICKRSTREAWKKKTCGNRSHNRHRKLEIAIILLSNKLRMLLRREEIAVRVAEVKMGLISGWKRPTERGARAWEPWSSDDSYCL